MSITLIILVAVIILTTHFVGAVTGFGSTLLALPFLVWVVGDLKTAVLTLLLVGTVQAYHILLLNLRHVVWRELLRILLWMGVGIPIGFMCMHLLPQTLMITCLGIVLILSGLSQAIPALKRTPPSLALNFLLFSGGVIHGAFVCGGGALAIYAQHALVRKDAVRGTLFMVWVIINTVLILSAFARGSITPHVQHLALAGLPFLFLGSWLGERAAREMEQQQFMQAMASLLIIAGGLTIYQAIRL